MTSLLWPGAASECVMPMASAGGSIAARITEYVQYISPVVGVQDELRKMGGDAAALADDPLLFPDAATLAKLKVFAALSEDEEAKFDARFAEITGA